MPRKTTKLDNNTANTKLFVSKCIELTIPLEGPIALACAEHFHRLGMDSACQWGNAYFRCPECGQARDCNGHEDWRLDVVAVCECWHDLTVDDLRISEGWAERLD